MKDTKTEFRIFLLSQWREEGRYLSGQHQKGWELVRVSGVGMYHFRRCEPKAVVYQLDYNPEGLAHREEYLQMFRDCGWEYLQDYAGYSYFRKAAFERDEGEEDIFCDDESRLDMMKRIFKGRMVPLLVIFFCVLLPQIFFSNLPGTPFGWGLWVFFCFLFGVYLATFGLFALSFGRYYRSVHRR